MIGSEQWNLFKVVCTMHNARCLCLNCTMHGVYLLAWSMPRAVWSRLWPVRVCGKWWLEHFVRSTCFVLLHFTNITKGFVYTHIHIASWTLFLLLHVSSCSSLHCTFSGKCETCSSFIVYKDPCNKDMCNKNLCPKDLYNRSCVANTVVLSSFDISSPLLGRQACLSFWHLY